MWFFHVLCEKYPPPKKKKNKTSVMLIVTQCFALPQQQCQQTSRNKKKHLEDPDVKSNIPSGPPIPIPCVLRIAL